MDTSVLLCPVNGTMITPLSVIQTETFCLWAKSPYLPSFASLCAICTNGHLQFCTTCTKKIEPLDDFESQEYDDIEEQGNKNGSRSFLQGTGTIRPDRWETLFGSDSDSSHRAFSPCSGIIYNVSKSGTTYIDVQIVELFTGRLFKSWLKLWFREMSGFFIGVKDE